MNYRCNPDIDQAQALDVDAISLFQRFSQETDKKTVDALLDQEFARHVKLCELAILNAAKADILWCDLPKHPIQDFDIWAVQHFEKMGFEVEHRYTANTQTVPSEHDEKKKIEAVVVRSYFTAKWHLAKPLDPTKVSAEWRRRELLEDQELVANPPKRQSTGTGDDIESGKSLWAAVLDERHVVEIQRINHRSYLCLFDLDGKFRHAEETNVAFGAMFGPDVGDLEAWQERAVKIVDSWNAEQPPV
jgi:hypothetical protein